MENTQYMEAITARRALEAYNFDDAMEGNLTVSLETQLELVEDDLLTYVHDNLANFIRHMRSLAKEDQEILLAYYLLKKTQNALALVHRSTQTIMSFRLRMAAKKMAAAILFEGCPNAKMMRPILEKAGLECSDEYSEMVSLSKLIEAYASCRSFQRVADVYHLHRPAIRRAMSRASKQLLQSKEPQEQALGAYVFGLVDKASASGVGASARKRRKMGNMLLADRTILGQFAIRVDDPNFDEVLTPRANQ